jgi:hypothetical protein
MIIHHHFTFFRLKRTIPLTHKNAGQRNPFLTNPPHYAIIRTSADCAFAGNQATERIESYHDTIQGSKKVEGSNLQL